MPNSKTHDIISIYFLPVLVGLLYIINFELFPIIIISFAYLFSSYMFNGDLDIHSEPYRRWLFLRWIWRPYRKMCRHRGLLSHGLIIGTIIRVIYICTIPVILLLYYGIDISFLFTYETMYILIGLECGAALHTICDKLF